MNTNIKIELEKRRKIDNGGYPFTGLVLRGQSPVKGFYFDPNIFVIGSHVFQNPFTRDSSNTFSDKHDNFTQFTTRTVLGARLKYSITTT